LVVKQVFRVLWDWFKYARRFNSAIGPTAAPRRWMAWVNYLLCMIVSEITTEKYPESNGKGERIMCIRTNIALVFVVFALAGCSSTPKLMPTPNIYLGDGGYPESRVPEDLRSNKVDVLFVTDRKPETSADGALVYGTGRSASLGFGSAIVDIGNDLSWQQLVEMSETSARKTSPRIRVISRNELGRFPPTPHAFLVVDGKVEEDPEVQSEYDRANLQLHQEVKRRMEQSGEFTIYHLKNLIRSLASFSEVERINILAHSRGTDVVTTALRELIIEARAAGHSPRKLYRIENLILAAPDLDFDIARQRLMAEKIGPAFGQITVYTTDADKALKASQTLMSGTRFGRIHATDLGEQEEAIFNVVKNVAFINVNDVKSFVGHGYYLSSPSTSSDIIRVINTGSKPGDSERPLIHQMLNFWDMPVKYPTPSE
jgi:esterase/lipase superfamily enzyme